MVEAIILIVWKESLFKRPISKGGCHHINCFSRWRRWKRRWRRYFAKKLRRSTQRYKKETGAQNNSEYPHNILYTSLLLARKFLLFGILRLLVTKGLRA